MNRWSAFALLLLFGGALAFRLIGLDSRPFHNDEAVNAIKVTDLWQHGRYAYDPDEYHGPALHYATLPFLWLSQAHTPENLDNRVLRLAPVFFGAGLILLLFLFRDGLGWHALVWSALFLAISPAMVFYSRYFIHEILLVFFTALALGAAWRYCRRPAPGWALLTGAALGLMFATKETFVLSLGALAVAGVVVTWRSKPGWISVRDWLTPIRWRHLGLALSSALLVWFLFFSSFGAHFQGLIDSFRTYLPWLKRAAGHSPHLHPWYFYLQRLGWFHPVKGPVWSEGLILALAFVGAVRSLRPAASPLHQALALYTLVLTAVYSAISYKTPWCLLNFYFGMILLAGIGAAFLVETARHRLARIAIILVLAVATVQLAFQSWRTSFAYSSDGRNPYVYAQTVPDILNLVQRVEGIARVSPNGFETVVKVIAPDSDYWPLPWSLRRFKNIGWYDHVPADPFSPIIIVASKLEARLDDKSDRKWIMVGLNELRPGQFFELYVELQLWTKYIETLPQNDE